MRVTVGAVAVLGLAVTVATAQPGKERAAAFRPPEPAAPGELPPVARGVAEEFPPSFPAASTPVPRGGGLAPRPGTAGPVPAWLSGVDPNVLPAAGSASKTSAARTLTPAALTKDESPTPPPPKLLDRIKNFPGDKAPAAQPRPQPVAQPAPQPQQPPQPTASTPFRGTGANGAPVFAGPPAYRWYGWGSVTPGANPLAPAGQYPKASANWYSITGATPGAFPVPVGDTGRVVPGTEPPTYGLAARAPAPAPVVPIAAQPQPHPAPQFVERSVERPEPPRFNPPTESKFMPGPSTGAVPPSAFAPPTVPVGVPTLAPPPAPPKPATAAIPSVLPPPSMPFPQTPSVPASPPVSAVVAPTATPAAPIARVAAPKPESAAALPPMPSVLPPAPPVAVAPPVAQAPSVAPVPPVLPAPTAGPVKAATEPKSISAVPAPLPTSVTTEPPREELKWQQSAEPAAPRPGTWAPANDAKPLPTVPVGPLPSWQTGGAKTAPVIRAQMQDNAPDPVATLIKQVCQGRADGLEVRWTGTKKLQVCFEIRTTDAAQKLVNDISKRPELTTYQIDFCVVVK